MVLQKIRGLLSKREPNWIRHDDARYIDGRLVCPRCDYHASVSMFGSRRELTCSNCGYEARIADGVLVFTDFEQGEYDHD